jgi:hypothetical protein
MKTNDWEGFKESVMPVLREIISKEVVAEVEKFYKQKETRLHNIMVYLDLLYKSQQAGHDTHREIEQALKQYREEAGI